jgi:hypothetical protein
MLTGGTQKLRIYTLLIWRISWKFLTCRIFNGEENIPPDAAM